MEEKKYVRLRHCEYPGCGSYCERQHMTRTPNGLWYCPTHARLCGLGDDPPDDRESRNADIG